MYRPFIFIVLFLFVFQNQSTGQSCKISGKVIDTLGQPIEGAVIISMTPLDSVMVEFASSDENGEFFIGKLKEDSLLIQVSFLGYLPHYETISCKDEAIFVSAKMYSQDLLLAAVTVTEERIPIDIKGDTVQYDARAFVVKPGDMTEDLLKKLPGVEVNRSGEITAMGKKVTKVLVDGKEFFGSNPQMATKNIPADAIKNVKVYDKKTDDEAYTKVDDGEEEITIDLEIKEDKKIGGFGKISLNGGNKERYAARGNYFKFFGKTKLSLIGMSNNTNQTGYSIDELMSFSGDQFGFSTDGDLPFGYESPDGFWNTHSGATSVDYNNKKFEAKTTLSILDKSSIVNGTKVSDEFQNENTKFIADEIFSRTSNVRKYNVSLNTKYKIDTTQEVSFRGHLSTNRNVKTFKQVVKNANTLGDVFSIGDQDNKSSKLDFPFSAKVNYRKKLGRTGALLAAFRLSNRVGISDRNNIDETMYFESDTIAINDYKIITSDEFRRKDSEKLSYSFTDFKKGILMFNVKRSHEENGNLFENSLFNGLTYQRLDSLSGDYLRKVDAYSFGAKQTIKIGKSKLQFGLTYSTSKLVGLVGKQEVVSSSYDLWAPNFSWRLPISGSKSIRFNYRVEQKIPSLREVLPIIEVPTSMYTYLGNPNLKPEKINRLRLSFNSFDRFNGTSLFASITYSYIKNAIVRSREIDSQYRRITKPVNIDHKSNLSYYGNLGWKISALKMKMSIGSNGLFSNGFMVLNDRIIPSINKNVSLNYRISNSKKKVFDFGVMSRIRYSDIQQGSNGLTNSYLNYTFTGDFSVVLPKGFEFKTQGLLLFYPEARFDTPQQPAVTWEINKYFGVKKKWQVGLSAFDLFQRNTGIKQEPSAFGLSASQTENVGRYFLLKASYKI